MLSSSLKKLVEIYLSKIEETKEVESFSKYNLEKFYDTYTISEISKIREKNIEIEDWSNGIFPISNGLTDIYITNDKKYYRNGFLIKQMFISGGAYYIGGINEEKYELYELWLLEDMSFKSFIYSINLTQKILKRNEIELYKVLCSDFDEESLWKSVLYSITQGLLGYYFEIAEEDKD